jgi:hypothetical protein
MGAALWLGLLTPAGALASPLITPHATDVRPTVPVPAPSATAAAPSAPATSQAPAPSAPPPQEPPPWSGSSGSAGAPPSGGYVSPESPVIAKWVPVPPPAPPTTSPYGYYDPSCDSSCLVGYLNYYSLWIDATQDPGLLAKLTVVESEVRGMLEATRAREEAEYAALVAASNVPWPDAISGGQLLEGVAPDAISGADQAYSPPAPEPGNYTEVSDEPCLAPEYQNINNWIADPGSEFACF